VDVDELILGQPGVGQPASCRGNRLVCKVSNCLKKCSDEREGERERESVDVVVSLHTGVMQRVVFLLSAYQALQITSHYSEFNIYFFFLIISASPSAQSL